MITFCHCIKQDKIWSNASNFAWRLLRGPEHAMQIDELPEIIPPELYSQDLESAEEQAAFAKLRDAVPGDGGADASPVATGASGEPCPGADTDSSNTVCWMLGSLPRFAGHCSAMVIAAPQRRMADVMLCCTGRPVAGSTQPAANGHSAFGSWALEQGDPITDVMRALRQPGKPPAMSSGAGLDSAARRIEAEQPAELQASNEASDDDADVSWWDTDLPDHAGNANVHYAENQMAVHAEDEAAEATGEHATGSLVWQREDAGGELQASPDAAHSWRGQQPGSDPEAQRQTGQQSGNEAAVPSADACSSAEEQWRLAYAQWYEAYMHWYASYTQWHAGCQQHCAGQASGSGSAQAVHAEQEHRR